MQRPSARVAALLTLLAAGTLRAADNASAPKPAPAPGAKPADTSGAKPADRSAEIARLVADLAHVDGRICREASVALVEIGEPAVPALIAAVNGKSVNGRHWSMMTLGDMRAVGKPAVPALVKALADRDAGIRRTAAEMLGLVKVDGKDSGPLIAALADVDEHVRFHAVNSLSFIDGVPAEALPVLIRMFGDEKEKNGSRGAAVIAVGRLQPPAKDAIPALEKLLAGKPSAQLRQTAEAVLARLRAAK